MTAASLSPTTAHVSRRDWAARARTSEIHASPGQSRAQVACLCGSSVPTMPGEMARVVTQAEQEL